MIGQNVCRVPATTVSVRQIVVFVIVGGFLSGMIAGWLGTWLLSRLG